MSDVRERLYLVGEVPSLLKRQEENSRERHLNPPPTSADGLYENILNSVRICIFHELAILLNFLMRCQNTPGSDIWHSERWIIKTSSSVINLLLSHALTASLSSLLLSFWVQPQKSHYIWNVRGKCNTTELPITILSLQPCNNCVSLRQCCGDFKPGPKRWTDRMSENKWCSLFITVCWTVSLSQQRVTFDMKIS